MNLYKEHGPDNINNSNYNEYLWLENDLRFLVIFNDIDHSNCFT